MKRLILIVITAVNLLCASGQENISVFNLLDNGGRISSSEVMNSTLQYLNDKNILTTYTISPFISGTWIQYESIDPIVVTGFSLVSSGKASNDPKSFKLFSSNDGSNWIQQSSVLGTTYTNRFESKVIKTNISNPYQAYKFYKLVFNQAQSDSLSISEFQLLGFQGKFESNLINDGGELSAQYTDGIQNLVDKTTNKYVVSNASTFWIQYESVSPVVLDSYRLTGTTSLNSASNPKSWELYGSENGSDWNILDTQRNKNFFNVDFNTQAYKLNTLMTDDNWGQYADLAQQTLQREYWNKNNENYYIHRNTPVNYGFNYWWMAHTLDVLIDGYNRTSDETYKIKINNLYLGVLKKNGNTLNNDFFDDMEWMGLALLRANDVMPVEWGAMNHVIELWNWIKSGWTTTNNGGITWDKNRPTKNACSNGPAMILAARLYQKTNDVSYLNWAMKIHDWMALYLVDPVTGMVWDSYSDHTPGMVFTYNMGTWMGGCFELYMITGEKKYLQEALNAADLVVDPLQKFSSPLGILFNNEGDGDGGLFKGIFMRYLSQMILRGSLDEPFNQRYIDYFIDNGRSLWNTATLIQGSTFKNTWIERPTDKGCDLSVHLSGTMLFELLDELKRYGEIPEADTNVKAYKFYKMTVLANNGAKDTEISEMQLLTKSVSGVKTVMSNNKLRINCQNSNLIIKSTTNEECDYTILDLNGKLINKGTVASFSTNEVTLPRLGIYLIQIHSKSCNYSQKIIAKGGN